MHTVDNLNSKDAYLNFGTLTCPYTRHRKSQGLCKWGDHVTWYLFFFSARIRIDQLESSAMVRFPYRLPFAVSLLYSTRLSFQYSIKRPQTLMQLNRAFSSAFSLSLRRRRAALTSSLYVAVLPHQFLLMLWWTNTTNHHYFFDLSHKQRYGGGRGWGSSHAREFVWSQSSCTCSVRQSCCYYGFIRARFMSLMRLGLFPACVY